MADSEPRESELKCPVGTWDSHMHVVEPNRFPLSANAKYTPPTHTLSEALAFESTLGISNVVLVQPSIYGNDNSCLFSALKELGVARARGVVQFDPSSIDEETLLQWHNLGVRGVRINLKSVGSEPSPEELTRALNRYADKIRRLGWVITIYLDMKVIPVLEKVVPKLDVKVCIDHYGSPELPQASQPTATPLDPYQLPGFSSLISLLQGESTYVKLSAPYRLSPDPELRDIEVITKELIRVRSKRLLYATDWPHTRFSGIDSRPFLEALLRWSGTQETANKIFQVNAEGLWGVRQGHYLRGGVAN